MRPTPRLVVFLIAFSFAAISLPAVAQQLIGTIPVGNQPGYAASNPATNKTYVANGLCNENQDCGAGTVTVIDGATNHTATINVGVAPGLERQSINPVTNKIYVANGCGNALPCGSSTGSVTVIDGATNNTATVSVGYYPAEAVVNPVTNKIYVANNCGNDPNCSSPGTVTVIDGATNNTTTIDTGYLPFGVAVNSVTNKIYVTSCGNDPSCNTGTVMVIDGATNNTTTINTGRAAYFVAVNSTTNKIYTANSACLLGEVPCPTPGSITVIDGTTLASSTISPGAYFPFYLEVNAVTDKIYVVNVCGNDPNCASSGTVTVIDGATNNFSSVNVGVFPFFLATDSVTNQTYVVNAFCNKGQEHTGLTCSNGPGTVTAIDGNNNTVTIGVGAGPFAEAINETTNRIYVANVGDNNVSVIAGANSAALQFVPVAPCRVADTRTSQPIQGGTSERFPISNTLSGCNIPGEAVAYALNVTVVPSGRLGYLTIWPAGQNQPVVSTMNSLDGRIKANAAIVPAGYRGEVSVYVSNTTNIILDIDGYFTTPGDSAFAFYPLPPCRIVDTRNANGHLGGPFLTGGQERDFRILESPCIPTGTTLAAYSFNVTAVPHPAHQRLGYLTVWPAGQDQPVASTLNNPTGTIVANATIVPAGTNGDLAVYPNNDTDLLIDIDGYFAAPGAGGLSLYPAAPCRVIDTRDNNGQPFQGERTVNVVGSACSPPAAAQAYVFNATVVPPGALGYLTLWPDGEDQPVVSTLNAIDGAITSNMAIVPTNNGSVDAYASALTQLILDISSYFAP